MNKDIIRNSKYTNIVLFVIITIAILFQICFFFKTMNPEINSNPYLHTTKISIAIFISSFIFFFKNKYWSIYLSIFINLWGMSNLIYYRANGIPIDAYSITMIGNMDGFWSSVPFYIELSDFICFFATIIIAISCILLKNDKKSYILGILCLFFSIIVHIYACERKMKRDNPTHETFESIKYYNPFSLNNLWSNVDLFAYSQELSTLHHFIFCTNQFIQKIIFSREESCFVGGEIGQIKQFALPHYSQVSKPLTSLVIILVESFENWVITPETTPNIYRFINNNENILYASKIKSQIRGGTSADGQMIVNTGLLPIKEGAVCYRFSNNTFPALSKLYQSSCNIIPGNQSVWNQRYMNIAYNIKDSYTIKTKDVSVGDDQIILQKYSKIYDKYEYSMILTISTHTPFESISEK